MRDQILKAGLVILWGMVLGGFSNALAKDGQAKVTGESGNVSDDKTTAETSKEDDVAGMSLESLTGLNVVVTSSSKKAKSLRNATSAIYVITSGDIRNSGFQHVAEFFRMV